MSKQLIANGTKVQVRDEKGVFTVLRQVGGGDDPLLEAYEMVNEEDEMYWVNVKDMMPTIGTTFGKIEWQERYDIACPHCNHEMQCEPSMFHKMGHITMGSGCCSKCDEVFAIHFNPFANRMIARMEF